MPLTAATLQALQADRARRDALTDALTRDITAYWAAAATAIGPHVVQAAQAVAAAAAAGRSAAAALRRSPAAQTALADVHAELAAAVRRADQRTTLAIIAAVHAATSTHAALIASQLPASAVAGAGAGLAAAAVTALVSARTDAARARLRLLPAALAGAVRADLARIRVADRNADRAAGRAARAVQRAAAEADRHIASTLTRALAIARTEMADAHRAAAAAAQAADADLLAGWVWVSRLSPTTCPSCWAMHGTVHPLSEPGPLDHPLGRCNRVPLLRPYADLGIDAPEPASAIPDAETVFRALPRDQQLQIMGPGRLRLLDSGAVSWADLARRRANPGWRPSYATTPVRDLTTGNP